MYLDLDNLTAFNSEIQKLEIKKSQLAKEIEANLIERYLDMIEEKKDKMTRGDFQHILEDLVYNAGRIKKVWIQ